MSLVNKKTYYVLCKECSCRGFVPSSRVFEEVTVQLHVLARALFDVLSSVRVRRSGIRYSRTKFLSNGCSRSPQS